MSKSTPAPVATIARAWHPSSLSVAWAKYRKPVGKLAALDDDPAALAVPSAIADDFGRMLASVTMIGRAIQPAHGCTCIS